MKKSLFAILAVAACFASCSEVVESTVLDNPISFDNYVGKDATTRATVVQGVESVNVNAFLRPKTAATGKENFLSNFMVNQAVNKVADGDGFKWDYQPSKFWPAADQVVDFVAWVPVASYTVGETTKNNISVENATLTFTVPEEVKHQSDLLVAEAQMGVNRVAEGTNNEPVSLKFKHLLSRIGFEIVATGIPTDNVNVVELVEVSLNGGFASSGTVDMTMDNKAIAGTDPVEYNTLAIEALPGTSTSKYTLTGTHFGWEDNKMTNATTVDGKLVGRKNSDDSYIMLIPDGNSPTHITVTYTITTKGSDDTTTTDDTVVTNTADFDLTGVSYEAGKAYKYIFRITLQSITFDVVETPWDEQDDIDITPKDPNA